MLRCFLLLFVLAVLINQSVSLVIANEDARARLLPMATGEWAPYVSEKLENHGGMTELVLAVVAEMGMELHYVFVPWVRAEALVRKGKVFAAFPYSKTKQRREQYDFSDPLMNFSTVFFYYKPYLSHVSFNQLSDLAQYRLVGVNGYSYINVLKEAGLSLQTVNHREQLILWLYHNKADLAPMDLIGGQNLIKESMPKEASYFAYIPKNIEVDEDENSERRVSHLLISRKYPNAKTLTRQFNAALKRLKKKKIYQDIILRNNFRQADQKTER